MDHIKQNRINAVTVEFRYLKHKIELENTIPK